VRGYLTWLAAADADGDPLTQARARDWAVRDYRTYLVTVVKNAPRTINTALAAIDDFYTRRGLGPASADRLDLPTQAPRALDAKTALRWIWAIAARTAPATGCWPCSRSTPGCASAKPSHSTSMTCACQRAKEPCGCGKGGKPRDLPIHAQLRTRPAGLA
jgi:hypothetical protein